MYYTIAIDKFAFLCYTTKKNNKKQSSSIEMQTHTAGPSISWSRLLCYGIIGGSGPVLLDFFILTLPLIIFYFPKKPILILWDMVKFNPNPEETNFENKSKAIVCKLIFLNIYKRIKQSCNSICVGGKVLWVSMWVWMMSLKKKMSLTACFKKEWLKFPQIKKD